MAEYTYHPLPRSHTCPFYCYNGSRVALLCTKNSSSYESSGVTFTSRTIPWKAIIAADALINSIITVAFISLDHEVHICFMSRRRVKFILKLPPCLVLVDLDKGASCSNRAVNNQPHLNCYTVCFAKSCDNKQSQTIKTELAFLRLVGGTAGSDCKTCPDVLFCDKMHSRFGKKRVERWADACQALMLLKNRTFSVFYTQKIKSSRSAHVCVWKCRRHQSHDWD